MKRRADINCLFLDVGGVLLTDGWDHHARKRAVKKFELEFAEFESRHRLVFETYEQGKLSFQDYLGRVVFYKKRSFTRDDFRKFMFAQSRPFVEMIDLVIDLKRIHGLKIAVVSNEARELNSYRIQHFGLDKVADLFITSCFVHLRKPDAEIFRLALDIAQVQKENVVFIDNTPMFVEIAEGLGIQSILHTDYRATRAALERKGLAHEDEGCDP